MKPIATRNTLIAGHRIAHDIYGSGEPLVLLHGTPASSLIWRNLLPHFTRRGWQVHLFDLLGYGHSERPRDPDVDTSISAQVPVLETLMQHWGLTSAHLVAHDFGGAVAQRYALAAPQSVRTLTLVDSVSFDSFPSPRTRELMQNGIASLLSAPDKAHRAHFRAWLLSAVSRPENLDPQALETYLELISGPVGQSSFFQHQLRHYDPRHTLEIAGRLHKLGQLPVKIIWGADDAWQDPAWAHRLQQAIPGAELSIVDGCGHFIQEDNPDALAGLLLDFLSRHRQMPHQAS